MRQNKHFEKSPSTLPFRQLRSSIRRANLSQSVKFLQQQPMEIQYPRVNTTLEVLKMDRCCWKLACPG